MSESNINMIMKQQILTSIDDTVDVGNSYAIGIQATPGTQFYFNGDNSNIITMGPSGIYQINFLEPIITSIDFESMINSLPIIIDYVQQEEQQNV